MNPSELRCAGSANSLSARRLDRPVAQCNALYQATYIRKCRPRPFGGFEDGDENDDEDDFKLNRVSSS